MTHFEQVIQKYLQDECMEDMAFAMRFERRTKEDGKAITGCCNYIISQVQESGRTGFADEEIYGMAKHFFDEEIAGPATAPSCRVVVNERVELPPEEKERLRREAEENVRREFLKAEEKRVREAEERRRKSTEAKARKHEEQLEAEGQGLLFDI